MSRSRQTHASARDSASAVVGHFLSRKTDFPAACLCEQAAGSVEHWGEAGHRSCQGGMRCGSDVDQRLGLAKQRDWAGRTGKAGRSEAG
jgi:hypothetical protein